MPERKPSQRVDDLTQIKGIGESTQVWLRETFDVITYEDLARLNADIVVDQLRETGRVTSHSQVTKWLAQAAELADESTTDAPASAEHTAEISETIATFVVVIEHHTAQDNYQTKVHHMESDVSQSWEGITQQALGAWIVQQLGDDIAQLANATSATAKPDAAMIPTMPKETASKLHRYINKVDTMTGQQTPTELTVTPQSAPEDAQVASPGAMYSPTIKQYLKKIQKLSGTVAE